MADQSIPRKNQAYVLRTTLISQADTNVMQDPPTVGAGDAQVSTDGGALGNTTNAPALVPAGDKIASVTLTAGEMNGDIIVVTWADVVGAQWQDQTWVLFPTDSTLAVIGAALVAIAAAIAALPAAVWSFGTRTLTQAAAAVIAAVTGSAVTQYRAISWNFSLTGMGSVADRDRLYFTIKERLGAPDSTSLVQIEETDGLLFIDSRPATGLAAQGTLTVDDAVAGNVTITLTDEMSERLSAIENLVYDIKLITAGGVSRLMTISRFNIVSPATEGLD